MHYYFAPLEGITDDLFRSIHHRHFPGVDRYYTPFLSPVTEGPAITKKELREVLPENNQGISLVPQLLTNRAEAFLRAAEILKDLGYDEVNLNLGCPSGTVCAKGKGAGFLSRREELERFLDEIFSSCPISVSIKTRLGKENPEEFHALLALYSRYPIRELTIHPRVQADLYRRPVRMEYFRLAQQQSPAPLCLSGGICVPEDLSRRFPEGDFPPALMLGRGLVANPGLVQQLKGGPAATRAQLRDFYDELFALTADRLSSPRSTMFRMKELWHYFILMFDDRDKLYKSLRKAATLTEYQSAVARIFRDLPLRENAEVNWV